MEMFRAFDPNGNGYLSLAEIDKGVRDVLKSDRLFEAKPAIMRAYQVQKQPIHTFIWSFNTYKQPINTNCPTCGAFQAAKNAVPGENKLGADFVERKEFRLLLLYLKRYFEIHSTYIIYIIYMVSIYSLSLFHLFVIHIIYLPRVF
jgi:hypothetical protein